MVRDKAGQMYLGDFLRAYAATPGVATAGELPGGGALFADCTRAVEPEPETLVISFGGTEIHRTKGGE